MTPERLFGKRSAVEHLKTKANSTAAQDAVFKEVIKTDKIRLTAKTMAGGEHTYGERDCTL